MIVAVTEDFKDALASWASGVAVIGTRQGDLVYAITISSFSSLSLDPPLVLACIANTNRLPPMVRACGRFAISLLSKDQDVASSALAKSGREPGATLGVPESATATGMPIVAGAMAYLDCELHADLPVGDHTILVGRVTAAVSRADGEPLLYYRRKYRTLDLTR